MSQRLTAEEKQYQKRQASVGLASNVLGITAGGAALGAAAKNKAFKNPSAENAGPATSRMARKFSLSSTAQKRLILAGAGGAVGLQAANLGGDLVTNRVLFREVKKNDQSMISKAEGAVSSNGHGKSLVDKAFTSKENTRETVLVPGYGFVNGAITRRPATKKEKQMGALGGAIAGTAIGAGGASLARTMPKASKRKLPKKALAAGIGLSALAGAGLGYSGNRYTRSFNPDNKKHAGAAHRPGKYVTASEQADSIRNTNYMAQRQREQQQLDLINAFMGNKVSKSNNPKVAGGLGAIPVIGAPSAAIYNATKAKEGRKAAVAGRTYGSTVAYGLGAGLAGGAGVLTYAAKKNKPNLIAGPSGKQKLALGALAGAGGAIGASRANKNAVKRGDIEKAQRRFDPEADRQRRIGMYSAGGALGAVYLGDKARGQLTREGARIIKPKGKKGALLGLSAIASGALGAGAYKRGVDVRNQPWT
jgi:hypothetical protein